MTPSPRRSPLGPRKIKLSRPQHHRLVKTIIDREHAHVRPYAHEHAHVADAAETQNQKNNPRNYLISVLDLHIHIFFHPPPALPFRAAQRNERGGPNGRTHNAADSRSNPFTRFNPLRFIIQPFILFNPLYSLWILIADWKCCRHVGIAIFVYLSPFFTASFDRINFQNIH